MLRISLDPLSEETASGPSFLIIPSKNPSQNLKKNIFKRSGKFLKNVRVPTETVALAVFSCRLKL
ncbi:hypothetical protein IQB76_12305 [Leptospira borgpetersenii serovar Hardjo-bovis]|nr:hypothetical protein B9T54_12095 [Leptospira borgpetersenii serovar Hardjo-bovis]TQE52088.1 hypothetical protein FFZ95_11840 [Leptospira borgpetersenii]AYR09080.1 hypothetical protein D1609_12025 [Leptospira borgpetersenii serovar Hardjo-bovis]MBE8351329.1 hypothetical protein [Leptospira borgpetersenii serovar Hardjo-bovis]MBE8360605.1 hypothetical protein [Leptospira borgpetersenii serovar Hardjo-bovis]